MFCEKCGNPVGDSEKFCSQCGAPLPEVEAELTSEASMAPTIPDATVEAEAEVTAESVPAEAEAAPVPLSVPQVKEEPIAPAIPEEKPNAGGKGRKKKKIPLIIAACVTLAIAAVCVVNAARLGNFFHRTFSSPEKYYQYVEQTTVSEIAERSSAYYEKLFVSSLNMGDRSTSVEFAMELGEGGKNLLELLELADVDLSWLTEISVGAGFSLKDTLLGYNVSLGVNKSDILSANLVLDMEENTMYLQMPELAEKYIGIDIEELFGIYMLDEFEEYLEGQENLSAIQEFMPNAKQVEKLTEKYLKIALSSVSNVDKSTETLKVEGVKQKCTELEVTFDGENLAEMTEAVLKEMLKDKDLKKLIIGLVDGLTETSYFDGISVDGEDVYDEFLNEIEDMLDSLDEAGDMDEELLIMKVYVDGKGKIVGRVFELLEDGETILTVSSLMPENGGRFGYEFSVQSDYDVDIALTGSGKTAGNKLTGDFALEYMGTPLLNLQVSKLDREQLEQGYFNGSVTITPSRMLVNMLTGDLSYYGTAFASMLTDMQLTLDSQISKESGKLTLGLLYDGEEMCSISMSVKTGDGAKTDIPNKKNIVFVEDQEDLADWLDGIDWDKFIGNLEKAGLPEEMVDTVEDIAGILTGKGLLEGLYGLDDGYLYNYDDYFGDDYFSDDYFGDDYFGDDYYGDDHYGDDHYGDDHYGDDHYGYDHYGDDTYGGNLGSDENSLEQLLQSDEWQSELKDLNDSIAETGITITIDTVADGNTLVFEFYLPDEGMYNLFGETEGSLVADVFFSTLKDENSIQDFGTEYGIWLDGVRCVIFRADGTEIYSDEIHYEY